MTAEVDVRDFGALKSAVDSGVEQLGRSTSSSPTPASVTVAHAGPDQRGRLARHDRRQLVRRVEDGKGRRSAYLGGRGGSIILTSSVGGLKAHPNIGPYVAAKHGVVGLTRTFAVELGRILIRANSVHPTNVNSPMFMHEATMKMFRPDLENPTADDMEVAAKFMHVLPVGWVETSDISNAVLFLASDESRLSPDCPHGRRRQHAQVAAPLQFRRGARRCQMRRCRSRRRRCARTNNSLCAECSPVPVGLVRTAGHTSVRRSFQRHGAASSRVRVISLPMSSVSRGRRGWRSPMMRRPIVERSSMKYTLVDVEWCSSGRSR